MKRQTRSFEVHRVPIAVTATLVLMWMGTEMWALRVHCGEDTEKRPYERNRSCGRNS